MEYQLSKQKYCYALVSRKTGRLILTNERLPNECNYRYEFGKYCKRPATKLHLPSGDYSCDEHSEYFRQRNDKIIDL